MAEESQQKYEKVSFYGDESIYLHNIINTHTHIILKNQVISRSTLTVLYLCYNHALLKTWLKNRSQNLEP